MRRSAFLLGVILALILFCLAVWKVPQWQVADPTLQAKDRLELEDKARGTLAQIFAGLGIAVGLYFTWHNIVVAREGQITERFTRAIDQLGSDRLEIRLGGIYASAKDYWPIMEVLTAFVRERAPWKGTPELQQDEPPEAADQTPEENPQQPEPSSSPDTDIQAILTVLGRRTRWYGNGEEQRLDLHETDLRRAILMGAHLEGADLSGADGLTREQLEQAHTDEWTQLPAYLTSPQ